MAHGTIHLQKVSIIMKKLLSLAAAALSAITLCTSASAEKYIEYGVKYWRDYISFWNFGWRRLCFCQKLWDLEHIRCRASCRCIFERNNKLRQGELSSSFDLRNEKSNHRIRVSDQLSKQKDFKRKKSGFSFGQG